MFERTNGFKWSYRLPIPCTLKEENSRGPRPESQKSPLRLPCCQHGCPDGVQFSFKHLFYKIYMHIYAVMKLCEKGVLLFIITLITEYITFY